MNGKPTSKLYFVIVALLTANSILYIWNSTKEYVIFNVFPSSAVSAASRPAEVSIVGSDQTIENDARKTSETTKAPTIKRKLNVMVFYPDDLRHDTIGAAGTQPVKTPFLDQLSREGIRFTQNAVTTSVCWISRATMVSGQYFARHKSRFLRAPIFCDAWHETYPYKLQQNGYFVGHVGKWQYHNFEFVVKMYNWTSLYEGHHIYNMNKKKVYSTTRDEQESIRFLKERPKDVPFVLTTAFYAPKAIGRRDNELFPMNKTEHLYDNVTIPLPLNPEEAFLKMPQFMIENAHYLEGRRRYMARFDFNETGKFEKYMKKYYRMVSEVDETIKNVVGELERQGILNDTVIIFTTDNGYFHGEHGLAGKWFPYQESIRIPLIIKDPRMGPDRIGTLEDAFTLNVDLATTILGAAGLAPHPRMQGRDIADLYLKPDAKATWRKEYFYEHPQMISKRTIPASSALVRKDFKYILYPDDNCELLFDLENDPFEHNDISKKSEYAALLAEMRTRHAVLKKSVE